MGADCAEKDGPVREQEETGRMTQMRIQGKVKIAALNVNKEYECGKNIRFQMFLQKKMPNLNPQKIQIK